MLTITRKFEFDAGHRIPHHHSECRNLHGHRYVMLVTLTGRLIEQTGDSSEGMILDFSEFKALTEEHLISRWDHAFLVHREDLTVRTFLESIPDHKTVVMDRVPTVENMTQLAFDILGKVCQERYGDAIRLQALRLYETPNCYAEVCAT